MPSRRRVPRPRILEFVFDEDNEAKIGAHGLDIDQVAEILDSRNVVKPNRRQRRAQWIVVGCDAAGRCIAVPIELTAHPDAWRPVTAWYCKEHEAAWLG